MLTINRVPVSLSPMSEFQIAVYNNYVMLEVRANFD